MESISVDRLTSTRIPNVYGEFQLALYENSQDDKDHLALTHGDVQGEENILVRVHSECFTGDVLGSLRCDCGEQLDASLRRIAEEGRGILLYLRQEGRGIGLLDKLRAYDLQDEGYDTVEANIMLGHGADERDYGIAAQILNDLDVRSIRLLTNNPVKIESLRESGLRVSERVPLQPHLNQHNTEYLRTKADRMRHLLDVGSLKPGLPGSLYSQNVSHPDTPNDSGLVRTTFAHEDEAVQRPFVTLTYAQSLDGSISASSGVPLRISGPESMEITHTLRASHDAILVGINTVLSDNPRLTVRHAEGDHPRPVILDTRLRCPETAHIFQNEQVSPIIATSSDANRERQQILERAGATVLRLECDEAGVCLDDLLQVLHAEGIESLMVEGGSEVITSFLRQRLVDYLIITVAPMLVGGTSAVSGLTTPALQPSNRKEQNREQGGPSTDQTSPHTSTASSSPFPRLEALTYRWAGRDLILEGHPVWPSESNHPRSSSSSVDSVSGDSVSGDGAVDSPAADRTNGHAPDSH
jgi:GTP cyclohydrolase II